MKQTRGYAMVNKKTVMHLSACLFFSTHTEITMFKASSNERLNKIERMSTVFAKTSFADQKAPDISWLKKQAFAFFAKYNVFGFTRYFGFETQDDANLLQLDCYNGWAKSIIWFYMPNTQQAVSTQ